MVNTPKLHAFVKDECHVSWYNCVVGVNGVKCQCVKCAKKYHVHPSSTLTLTMIPISIICCMYLRGPLRCEEQYRTLLKNKQIFYLSHLPSVKKFFLASQDILASPPDIWSSLTGVLCWTFSTFAGIVRHIRWTLCRLHLPS